ncbi:MAG: hypothetical protein IPP73_02030 [Chitinophagaceae bacterium]|nr:hypothetical protein [Chitinophagaceae bacterium]
MKLAALLSQFLAKHKRLDLPGIGVLTLDDSIVQEPEAGITKPISGVISFQQKPIPRESPELVQFIAGETGKQKALASSDLESYLELAQQFLNIGKPFMLEGIGSLSRTREGILEFTPGQLIPEVMRDNPARDSQLSQETHPDYKSILYHTKATGNWKKPVAFLLVIAGLAFAIWGGYTIYKKTAGKKQGASGQDAGSREQVAGGQVAGGQEAGSSAQVGDTTTNVKPDTVVLKPVVTPNVSGTFKYILEVSPAKRALERFTKLKRFQWPVEMTTTDSLSFTIFMRLPGNASDTTRLLDSLSRLNGKRVYLER